MTAGQIAKAFGFDPSAPTHPMCVEAGLQKDAVVRTCTRLGLTMVGGGAGCLAP
jgi:hypothetical protein